MPANMKFLKKDVKCGYWKLKLTLIKDINA